MIYFNWGNSRGLTGRKLRVVQEKALNPPYFIILNEFIGVKRGYHRISFQREDKSRIWSHISIVNYIGVLECIIQIRGGEKSIFIDQCQKAVISGCIDGRPLIDICLIII
jgi:hypothetical protein